MGLNDDGANDPIELAKQLGTYGRLDRRQQYRHRPPEENILFERVREQRLKLWLTATVLLVRELIPFISHLLKLK